MSTPGITHPLPQLKTASVGEFQEDQRSSCTLWCTPTVQKIKASTNGMVGNSELLGKKISSADMEL